MVHGPQVPVNIHESQKHFFFNEVQGQAFLEKFSILELRKNIFIVLHTTIVSEFGRLSVRDAF